MLKLSSVSKTFNAGTINDNADNKETDEFDLGKNVL